jgi:signal peptidase II
MQAKSKASEPSSDGFSSRRLWLAWIALALLLAGVDQVVKALVAHSLPLHTTVEVTAWFNLVHVLNPGAAFSFLADAGGWQRYALGAVALIAASILSIVLWRGVRGRLETAASIGIIGGALGNFCDRITKGAVVDYLDFHWGELHWPAFNLADVWVVGGAALMLLATVADRSPPAVEAAPHLLPEEKK